MLSPVIYAWVKIAHLSMVIFWMAGMLYLPRLFVYHTQTKIGSESYSMLLIMEKRLLKLIMLPAIIAAFVTGLTLFFHKGGFSGPKYIYIKLLLVLIMGALHGFLSLCYKKFVANSNTKSKLFFLVINEVPAILIIIIMCVIYLNRI